MEKVLESRGYRSLFECVEKEGIHHVLNLFNDIQKLPKKEILAQQAIMGKETAFTVLAKNNKDVIKYIKERGEEFAALDFSDENILNTLVKLYDINLLELFLENARRLEKLRVERIRFTDIRKEEYEYHYHCDYWLSEKNTIERINKCFTDGEVCPRLTEEEVTNYSFKSIPFNINIINNQPFTFVLKTKDCGDSQYREIDIMDFSFDGSKLPTEEEIQSREIPKSLIKNTKN